MLRFGTDGVRGVALRDITTHAVQLYARAAARELRCPLVVIGFDSALLKSLKERDPKWQTAWLCSFDKKPNGKPRNAPAKVLKTLKDMRAHALMSGRGDVDKGLLDQIRAAGMEHYVWTINDPKLGPSYKAQGVDAIITDLPAELRAVLNSSANH